MTRGTDSGRRTAGAHQQHPETAAVADKQATSPKTRPSAQDLLSKTGGAPLPASVRQQMERAFSAPFGRVSLHHGDEAGAFDAAAFTAGERIFLPRSAPRLDRGEGLSLLAHELTHVLQQRRGQVPRPADGVTVDPRPDLEEEAERSAQQIMQGLNADGRAAAAPKKGGPEGGGETRGKPSADERPPTGA